MNEIFEKSLLGKYIFTLAIYGLFSVVFVLYRETLLTDGIRTRIIGVEGKLADHLTTTKAS